MKQIGLVVGIVVLIAALVFINNGIGKNARPEHGDDDGDSQTSSQTQKAPAAAPATAGQAAGLPPEQTIGNPATAKYHVTVGWVYDSANQAKPQAMSDALDAVRQYATYRGGIMSAQIVDLDLPIEQRSPEARAVTRLGVSINGKPLRGLSDNPGEGRTIARNITNTLMAATR